MINGNTTYTELSTTIWTSLVILIRNFYKDYRFLFHLSGSFLLIYIFYLLGKWKRPSVLEKKIQAINQYQMNIQKISSIQKKRTKIIQVVKFIFILFTVFCVIFNLMLYFTQKQVNVIMNTLGFMPIKLTNEKIAISGGSVVLLLIIWVGLIKVLNYLQSIDKKHLTYLQRQQQPQLNDIIKALGPKALQKIKQNQCKDILQTIRLKQSQGCSKCKSKDSQNYWMQQKCQNYKNLIESVFAFKWCDVCSFKKKTPSCGQIQFPVPQKPFTSEQQEVKYRIQQLYKRSQKVDKYLKSLCQKKCSYNYWKQSKVNGKSFIATKTNIDDHLEAYQRKKI